MRFSSTLMAAVVTAVLVNGNAFAQTNEAPAAASTQPQSATVANAAGTVDEARGRARILHEAMHGALQVMHRDFFREDEGLQIPSRSLEDVFSELARSYGVKLRWIAVDAKPMNIDHEPASDFETQAAWVLKSGESEFESVTDQQYQYAGRIRLSATCLSCHASRRSDNDDRSAGLVITMPLVLPSQTTKAITQD